jgi:hypothetical protein
MTDKELEKAIAVEVMGYYWCNAEGYNLNIDRVATPSNWRPLTNANHRDMVVERMRELGWYISIEPTPDRYLATILLYGIDETVSAIGGEKHKKPGHAVCLAALKAVRGKKP